jgi:hypothetical protein
VERADIRNAEQKMPAYLKRTRHFVKDPKDFLGMLKHLICHDEVGLAICKRQVVTFDISHVNLICFPCQCQGILRSTLHRNKFSPRVKSSHDFQISSRSGP